jgi:5-formyltetrahydrofolate cyclo-ligase
MESKMPDYTQRGLPKKSRMDKSKFRQFALGRLRSISRTKALLYDHMIRAGLQRYIEKKKPASVMIYVPLDTEVNTVPLINTLRRRGVRVYVPFMEGESFRLVQYRLPLKRKKYGVQEPNFSNKYRNRMIDIAIVPIVGTDRSWKRIGFGKGMYDRFFANHGCEVERIVFVQRVLLQSREVITDSWDVMADELCAVSRH